MFNVSLSGGVWVSSRCTSMQGELLLFLVDLEVHVDPGQSAKTHLVDCNGGSFPGRREEVCSRHSCYYV
jgi:hypothetical protein